MSTELKRTALSLKNILEQVKSGDYDAEEVKKTVEHATEQLTTYAKYVSSTEIQKICDTLPFLIEEITKKIPETPSFPALEKQGFKFRLRLNHKEIKKLRSSLKVENEESGDEKSFDVRLTGTVLPLDDSDESDEDDKKQLKRFYNLMTEDNQLVCVFENYTEFYTSQRVSYLPSFISNDAKTLVSSYFIKVCISEDFPVYSKKVTVYVPFNQRQVTAFEFRNRSYSLMKVVGKKPLRGFKSTDWKKLTAEEVYMKYREQEYKEDASSWDVFDGSLTGRKSNDVQVFMKWEFDPETEKSPFYLAVFESDYSRQAIIVPGCRTNASVSSFVSDARVRLSTEKLPAKVNLQEVDVFDIFKEIVEDSENGYTEVTGCSKITYFAVEGEDIEESVMLQLPIQNFNREIYTGDVYQVLSKTENLWSLVAENEFDIDKEKRIVNLKKSVRNRKESFHLFSLRSRVRMDLLKIQSLMKKLKINQTKEKAKITMYKDEKDNKLLIAIYSMSMDIHIDKEFSKKIFEKEDILEDATKMVVSFDGNFILIGQPNIYFYKRRPMTYVFKLAGILKYGQRRNDGIEGFIKIDKCISQEVNVTEDNIAWIPMSINMKGAHGIDCLVPDDLYIFSFHSLNEISNEIDKTKWQSLRFALLSSKESSHLSEVSMETKNGALILLTEWVSKVNDLSDTELLQNMKEVFSNISCTEALERLDALQQYIDENTASIVEVNLYQNIKNQTEMFIFCCNSDKMDQHDSELFEDYDKIEPSGNNKLRLYRNSCLKVIYGGNIESGSFDMMYEDYSVPRVKEFTVNRRMGQYAQSLALGNDIDAFIKVAKTDEKHALYFSFHVKKEPNEQQLRNQLQNQGIINLCKLRELADDVSTENMHIERLAYKLLITQPEVDEIKSSCELRGYTFDAFDLLAYWYGSKLTIEEEKLVHELEKIISELRGQ